LFFGLVLLAIGLVWAGFDWPLGWFCHTDLATLLVTGVFHLTSTPWSVLRLFTRPLFLDLVEKHHKVEEGESLGLKLTLLFILSFNSSCVFFVSYVAARLDQVTISMRLTWLTKGFVFFKWIFLSILEYCTTGSWSLVSSAILTKVDH